MRQTRREVLAACLVAGVLGGLLGCLGKVSGDPLTQVLANVLGLDWLRDSRGVEESEPGWSRCAEPSR